MNELQKIDKRVSRELQELYDDLKAELTGVDSVGEAMSNVNYYTRTKLPISSGVGDASIVATIGTPFSVEKKEIVDWFLFTEHAGGKLSDTLRSGEARNAIKDVLKSQLKYETSVYSVERVIKKDEFAKLPKVFENMLDNARRSGQSKATIKSIREAERHLQSIGKGNTKDAQKLRKAYSNILRDVKSGKSFDDSVKYAVDTKASAINRRITRTEISRAENMTAMRAYEEDPNTNAYRWVLSPSHPLFDECDIYADTDAYGLGAGIYPVTQGPEVPAHPNCLCTTEPVKGKQGEGGRYSKDRVLKGVSKDEKKFLLRGKKDTAKNIESGLKRYDFQRGMGSSRDMIPKTLLKEG